MRNHVKLIITGAAVKCGEYHDVDGVEGDGDGSVGGCVGVICITVEDPFVDGGGYNVGGYVIDQGDEDGWRRGMGDNNGRGCGVNAFWCERLWSQCVLVLTLGQSGGRSRGRGYWWRWYFMQ